MAVEDKAHVSEDGYLLSKVVPLSTVTRFIDWKELNLTDDYIKEQSKLKLGKLVDGKFIDERIKPDWSNQEEVDRFIIAEMCAPYNPPPDDRDVFLYYNDIQVLSGTAGYIRLRDGYVWGRKVIAMS
jgi:hypothetical protein